MASSLSPQAGTPPDGVQYLESPSGARLAYCAQPGTARPTARPTTQPTTRPTVVFLSGFRSHMGGTKAQALADWCAEQDVPYVRSDYRGHGASSGVFEDCTLSDWLADTLAIMDQVTHGPLVLVGSSMGGWLMLLAALQRPERIHALVGVAAAPDFTETLIWNTMDPATQEATRQSGLYHAPSCYDGEPYPITYRLIEDGRQHLLLHAPIPLTCPVRLLHGKLDADVPWETSFSLMHKLTSEHVRLSMIPDGDHRLSRPADLGLLTQQVGEVVFATAAIGT